MSNLLKLASDDDINVSYQGYFSKEDLDRRHKEYDTISNIQFQKSYRDLLFSPIELNINNKSYIIQMNFCNNVFCKW